MIVKKKFPQGVLEVSCSQEWDVHMDKLPKNIMPLATAVSTVEAEKQIFNLH